MSANLGGAGSAARRREDIEMSASICSLICTRFRRARSISAPAVSLSAGASQTAE
jgi:hypothetical protein